MSYISLISWRNLLVPGLPVCLRVAAPAVLVPVDVADHGHGDQQAGDHGLGQQREGDLHPRHCVGGPYVELATNLQDGLQSLLSGRLNMVTKHKIGMPT